MISKQEFSPAIRSTSLSRRMKTFKIITSFFFIILVILTFAKTIPTSSSRFTVTIFPNSLENKLAEKLDDIDRARVLVGFYKKIQKRLENVF